MKKVIITVIGARPQFIKCSPVSKELRKHFKEVLIHTGQHYDENMSELFFKQLNIPEPDYNLGIGSDSHAVQTGEMMIELEKLMILYNPDLVLIYGDTNSTLAGAISASKLNFPIAHIEAGLRSFNRQMPEEINRIIADKLSSLHFCPTPTAVNNLDHEGIDHNVFHTGDVMYDALLQNLPIAQNNSHILDILNLMEQDYYLVTVHRAENTNDIQKLKNILEGLNQLDKKVILPLHPRTKGILHVNRAFITLGSNIQIIDPVGYLDMLLLELHSYKILTDSGGIQKEAFFLKKPCITLREETEWIELIDMGVNVLTGNSSDNIVKLSMNFNPDFSNSNIFGNGMASHNIIEIINNLLL